MNILPINQNGYSKEYWGPRLWYLLHKITYNYPIKPSNDEKSFYLKYFSTIVRIIPCPYCSDHLFTAIQNDRLYLSLENRQLVIEWFKSLHNKINASNGKRIYTGFELDMMYENSVFNHDTLNELILYILELTMYNIIEKNAFIYWILTTFKIHPCKVCKMNSAQYFLVNDISKLDWNDNSVRKNWIIGLIQINSNHS
jgi:hypothetical protein